MKKNFESILLSIMFGSSVLLGLSFWLNIKFKFNLFSAQHWHKLSELQATHTPINVVFYISICIAIFLFISGQYMIFRPKFRNIFKHTKEKKVPVAAPVQPEPIPQPAKEEQNTTPQPNLVRPRMIDLPKNIHEIAAAKYSKQNTIPKIPQKDTSEYNNTLAEIFTENNYVVKKLPVISGFTPNLFAIGANEMLWIGAIDCDINKIKTSIEKISEVFEDTLADIQIHINGFLIDTLKRYDSDDTIKIFHNIDDLKQFISDNPGAKISEQDQEDFDAYSEYIDTIIQYIKNI